MHFSSIYICIYVCVICFVRLGPFFNVFCIFVCFMLAGAGDACSPSTPNISKNKNSIDDNDLFDCQPTISHKIEVSGKLKDIRACRLFIYKYKHTHIAFTQISFHILSCIFSMGLPIMGRQIGFSPVANRSTACLLWLSIWTDWLNLPVGAVCVIKFSPDDRATAGK